MPSDYSSIKEENILRYGTDIGRIGPMLLANRYADRAHFIYELLQNAEDALARRDGWSGSRAVEFELSATALRVSHFGTPFSDADIRGICGIGEGTKDLTSIGRFGIGFKSVYAFTDCPEIHSGNEHFAIDSFVWPRAIKPAAARPGETVFVFPFRSDDVTAFNDITLGLRKLGPRVLLFLREIEEISWSVEGGASGLYLRSTPEKLTENTRKVVIVGEEKGVSEAIEETWLVFSREVRTNDGVKAGYVEVAFALGEASAGDSVSVWPVDDSVLFVFFPTIVTMNLGFLTQGPYRTTPSRDNVPRYDSWNHHLVRETAMLLVESLRSLRGMGLLAAEVLQCLPLDRSKFGETSMFASLFEEVRKALLSEPLLPCFGGNHVAASVAKLARTQELRELFSPAQLGSLLQTEGEIAWLCEEITQDRTPELRQYLREELNVEEVVPEAILSKLTKNFLEAQSDDWIVRLYEFLNGQAALLRQGRLNDVPLVRLKDGIHVVPRKSGQPQAFLPGNIPTAFPTVRRTVCTTDSARALLIGLGLTEPDPVDDVIRNLLPGYQVAAPSVSAVQYAADIQRILTAFATDSKSRRETLVSTLRTCRFLAAVDAGSGARCFAQPAQIYLATERLKELFEGVPGVLIVDDVHNCLHGEAARDLLEACGVSRYLDQVQVESRFTWQERAEMRTRSGTVDSTRGETIDDFTLRGLDEILNTLPSLDGERASKKAEFLWEALCDVAERRGTRAFSGSYRWFYHYQRSCAFDASFVRQLNETAWIPDLNGTLQPVNCVVFEKTGWKENPVLRSIVRFKPPLIEALAREAGIEPGVLDLLKKLGVTSEAELRHRLGIKDDKPQADATPDGGNLTAEEALRKLLGDKPPPTSPVGGDEVESGTGPGDAGGSGTGARGGADGSGSGRSHKGGNGPGEAGRQGTSTAGRTGKGGTSAGDAPRTFISYLGVHPDNNGPDPDGLGQEERMALEERAIRQILGYEPGLRRTPANNPGFDLFELDTGGNPVRWVEVKAMTATLHDRPVGLSRTQFDTARQYGDAYWLYVVEHAGTVEQARIIRIQDPAGKARTFTYDHGWLSVAEASDLTEPDQQE